jgi:biopolymer transport protein ExbB/TolQ
MSTEFILLSALFLAIPVTAKTVTSFQIRELLDALKRRERDIDALYNKLDGLEQEREVIVRAVLQVDEQRRWSRTRRDLMAEELQRARHRSRPRRAVRIVEDDFVPDTPPSWEPPAGLDLPAEAAQPSAAAAEAAA